MKNSKIFNNYEFSSMTASATTEYPVCYKAKNDSINGKYKKGIVIRYPLIIATKEDGTKCRYYYNNENGFYYSTSEEGRITLYIGNGSTSSDFSTLKPLI